MNLLTSKAKIATKTSVGPSYFYGSSATGVAIVSPSYLHKTKESSASFAPGQRSTTVVPCHKIMELADIFEDKYSDDIGEGLDIGEGIDIGDCNTNDRFFYLNLLEDVITEKYFDNGEERDGLENDAMNAYPRLKKVRMMPYPQRLACPSLLKVFRIMLMWKRLVLMKIIKRTFLRVCIAKSYFLILVIYRDIDWNNTQKKNVTIVLCAEKTFLSIPLW